MISSGLHGLRRLVLIARGRCHYIGLTDSNLVEHKIEFKRKIKVENNAPGF